MSDVVDLIIEKKKNRQAVTCQMMQEANWGCNQECAEGLDHKYEGHCPDCPCPDCSGPFTMDRYSRSGKPLAIVAY